jgi:hypothetical protein
MPYADAAALAAATARARNRSHSGHTTFSATFPALSHNSLSLSSPYLHLIHRGIFPHFNLLYPNPTHYHRIIEDETEPPLLSKELMDQLLHPKKYKIRLYCLRGVGLAAMDMG